MLLYNSDFKAFFFSQNYELSKSLLPVHVHCGNLFWIYTAKSGLRHTEETVISNRQGVLYSLGRAACLKEPLPPPPPQLQSFLMNCSKQSSVRVVTETSWSQLCFICQVPPSWL